MRQVSVFEAKAHLSQLIEDVFKHHEPVTITRRGTKVVVLIPFPTETKRRVNEILNDFKVLQKKVKHTSLVEIQKWKKMGRL